MMFNCVLKFSLALIPQFGFMHFCLDFRAWFFVNYYYFCRLFIAAAVKDDANSVQCSQQHAIHILAIHAY